MNQAEGIRRLKAEQAAASRTTYDARSSRAHVVVVATNHSAHHYAAALSMFGTMLAARGKRLGMLEVNNDVLIQQLAIQQHGGKWLLQDIASFHAQYPLPMVSLFSGGRQFIQATSQHEHHLPIIEHLDRHMDYLFIVTGHWQAVSTTFFSAPDTILFVTESTEHDVQQTYTFIKHMAQQRRRVPILLTVNNARNRYTAKTTYDTLHRVAHTYLDASPELKWLGALPPIHPSSLTDYSLQDPTSHHGTAMRMTVNNFIAHKNDRIGGARGFFAHLQTCSV